jgi:hypothetical protein
MRALGKLSSAAKAALYFALTARLKPCPFKTKSRPISILAKLDERFGKFALVFSF